MIQWEFKSFPLPNDEELQKLGKRGWQIAALVPTSVKTMVLMQRPIQSIPSISQSCLDTLILAHNKDDYGAFLSLESVRELLSYLGLQ